MAVIQVARAAAAGVTQVVKTMMMSGVIMALVAAVPAVAC